MRGEYKGAAKAGGVDVGGGAHLDLGETIADHGEEG